MINDTSMMGFLWVAESISGVVLHFQCPYKDFFMIVSKDIEIAVVG